MFRVFTIFLVLFSFLGSVVGPAFEFSLVKKAVATSESESPDPKGSDSEETDSSNSDPAGKDKFLFSFVDLRIPDYSRLALDLDSHGLRCGVISTLDRPPKV